MWFGHQKERRIDTCYSLDGPHKQCSDREPDPKGHRPNDSFCRKYQDLGNPWSQKADGCLPGPGDGGWGVITDEYGASLRAMKMFWN